MSARTQLLDKGDKLGSCLDLSAYEMDLCKRLALSLKTDPAVKRMAKLLLEMHRFGRAADIARRTGVPVHVIAEIQQLYVHEGLQAALLNALPQPTFRHADKVELTAAERAFCEQVVSSQKGSNGRVRRARALLLLNEGMSKPCTAQAVNVCERTLERLMDRYQTHGAKGAVNDAERPGRPVRYSKEAFVPLIQQVIQWEQPAALMRWTMADLRQSLARHHQEAIEMSMPTLRALVQAAGFRFRSLSPS